MRRVTTSRHFPGEHHGSANEVSAVVRSLRDVGYEPGVYDLVNKNCNSFSNEFAIQLIGVPIPRWINR